MTDLTRQFRKFLPWFLLAEAVSYLGFYWPFVNSLGFVICLLIAVFFAVKNFDYLVAFLLAELVIGSKGHLFIFSIHGFDISVRMMLWLVTILTWLVQAIRNYLKSEDQKINFTKIFLPKEIGFFIPLLLFVALAILLGVLHGNGLKNIYADANAWLYFLLIWPFSYALKNITEDKLAFYFGILTVAIAWLTIKTWLILYFFSHDFLIIGDFYKWVRDSGVGEITAMKGSFYRIFIQSHVYPLVALVVIWYDLALAIFAGSNLRALLNSKNFINLILASSGLLSIILIGLSRSFWVGLLAALVSITIIFMCAKGKSLLKNIKKYLLFAFSLGFSFVISLFIILLIIKIPIPKNTINFDAASVLSDRATESNESAIGSRWAMLPVLGRAISDNFFFGSGFGKTVTYKSEDPRVIAATGGTYTTYAFEWGWLDMWLKLGLFGILAYLYLIYKLWQGAAQTPYIWHVRLVLVSLLALHIFTPYLNHPLGIGLLLIIASLEFSFMEGHAPRSLDVAGLPKRLFSSILQHIKIKPFKT